jgi:hypothetical protein
MKMSLQEEYKLASRSTEQETIPDNVYKFMNHESEAVITIPLPNVRKSVTGATHLLTTKRCAE